MPPSRDVARAVVVRRAHAVEVAQARERGEDERSVPGDERDGVPGEAEGPEGGHRRERLERVREGLEGVVREVEGDEGGLRGDLRGRERRDAAVREPEVEQRRGFERGRRVGDVVDRGVDRAEALAPGQVRGEAEEAVRREHERLEARERGEADVGEARQRVPLQVELHRVAKASDRACERANDGSASGEGASSRQRRRPGGGNPPRERRGAERGTRIGRDGEENRAPFAGNSARSAWLRSTTPGVGTASGDAGGASPPKRAVIAPCPSAGAD